ncbi:MAG: Dolichyl-phosphate-mannose-protein mannosyltransferase [Candidatus Amesbacteria bacterium GW2011_GWB1_48_13]|uniref:Glycosyltransferase RgtA/B/C/D-like domain-containing protein n=3 Tax=Candidatus Amesiibacteriota TaxID=1752730 RepID=A0A1F4ZVC9_9BACT|nr:MAG: Dolichyl-phosphate-mannose-protein mannosyltransferase [Candidatus Amesbacteria bacterium GW2011_GWB1_48_13]OGD10403.1 MAG: hypothetical protein A2395_04790 [Candidatus Amesbacteria bacterium RIFOXYB1_FULL_47_9]
MSTRHFIILLVFLSVFMSYLMRGINLPFVGPNAGNMNMYSQIARNYIRFGYRAPINSPSPVLETKPLLYLHHPPLTSILISVFFRFFGENYSSARLSQIIPSLFSAILAGIIGSKLWGKTAGFFGTVVYTLLPSSSVFGRISGLESFTVFWILLSAVFLIDFRQTARNRSLAVASVCLIFGTWTDWPVAYFAGLAGLFFILEKRTRAGFLIWSSAAAAGLIFLVYTVIMAGSLSDLISAIISRSGGRLLTLPYWLVKWLVILAVRAGVYFGPVIMAVFFVFLLKYFSFKSDWKMKFTALIGGFAVINILLYPEGSFSHPYWIFYLGPFIALSTAYTLLRLYNSRQVLAVSLVLTLSLIWAGRVEGWKTREIEANLWRWKLASSSHSVLTPYESVAVNSEALIDGDILAYSFGHASTIVPDTASARNGFSHYLYSCRDCVSDSELVKNLSRYTYSVFTAGEGTVYVFDLASDPIPFIQASPPLSPVSPLPIQRPSLLKYYYSRFLMLTEAPQL